MSAPSTSRRTKAQLERALLKSAKQVKLVEQRNDWLAASLKATGRHADALAESREAERHQARAIDGPANELARAADQVLEQRQVLDRVRLRVAAAEQDLARAVGAVHAELHPQARAPLDVAVDRARAAGLKVEEPENPNQEALPFNP